MLRPYDYVGPTDIRDRVAGHPAGTLIKSVADLLAWVHGYVKNPSPPVSSSDFSNPVIGN